MPTILDVADEIEVLRATKRNLEELRRGVGAELAADCTSPAPADVLGGCAQQPAADTWRALFLLATPAQSPSSSRSVARRPLLQIACLQG
jgi:hypothetical protein